MNRKNFLVSLIAIPAGLIAAAKSSDAYTRVVTPAIGRRPSPAKFTLFWGGHGTGKTFRALEELVRHCYDNENALALIIEPFRATSWEKLLNEVLPKMQMEMPLSVGPVRRDANRHEYFWIQNRHGSHSMVQLVMARGEGLRNTMRGVEPSFLLAPNLDYYYSSEEWHIGASKLGRRRGIAHQPFISEARPDVGPDHWIYHYWFEGSEDPAFSNVYFPADVGAREVEIVRPDHFNGTPTKWVRLT